MNLRPYVPADAEALARVYRDSVTLLGAQGYDEAQVSVWASFADDLSSFRERLERGLTVVAEEDGIPVAFAQLNPADHVQFLYCAPSHARRGIATALYSWLELFAAQRGEEALTTDASRVSRGFFEKMGFEVVESETVERSGVILERFKMRKALG
jgi:putative acetyltransferase